MTRVLWFVLALLLCGTQPILGQQTTAIEGTAVCQSVEHWFADAYARAPYKSNAGVEPYLVLYNGQPSGQIVTITAKQAGQPPSTVTRVVPPGDRVTVDLFTAIANRQDANFSVTVRFETYGAADLKMWSGSSVVATAHPLTVCRNTP